jgi:PadR family transcriptional regulator, regulatory protein PadR
VAATWGASENNRQAKFYALTKRGRAQLRVETDQWRRYAAAVFAALEAPALK